MKNLLILLILLMSVEHVQGMDSQENTDHFHQVLNIPRNSAETNQPENPYKTPSHPYVKMEEINEHYPQDYFDQKTSSIVSKLINR